MDLNFFFSLNPRKPYCFIPISVSCNRKWPSTRTVTVTSSLFSAIIKTGKYTWKCLTFLIERWQRPHPVCWCYTRFVFYVCSSHVKQQTIKHCRDHLLHPHTHTHTHNDSFNCLHLNFATMEVLGACTRRPLRDTVWIELHSMANSKKYIERR